MTSSQPPCAQDSPKRLRSGRARTPQPTTSSNPVATKPPPTTLVSVDMPLTKPHTLPSIDTHLRTSRTSTPVDTSLPTPSRPVQRLWPMSAGLPSILRHGPESQPCQSRKSLKVKFSDVAEKEEEEAVGNDSYDGVTTEEEISGEISEQLSLLAAHARSILSPVKNSFILPSPSTPQYRQRQANYLAFEGARHSATADSEPASDSLASPILRTASPHRDPASSHLSSKSPPILEPTSSSQSPVPGNKRRADDTATSSTAKGQRQSRASRKLGVGNRNGSTLKRQRNEEAGGLSKRQKSASEEARNDGNEESEPESTTTSPPANDLVSQWKDSTGASQEPSASIFVGSTIDSPASTLMRIQTPNQSSIDIGEPLGESTPPSHHRESLSEIIMPPQKSSARLNSPIGRHHTSHTRRKPQKRSWSHRKQSEVAKAEKLMEIFCDKLVNRVIISMQAGNRMLNSGGTTRMFSTTTQQVIAALQHIECPNPLACDCPEVTIPVAACKISEIMEALGKN